MRKERRKEKLYMILAAVFAVAALCGLLYFLIGVWQKKHAEEVYDGLRETETAKEEIILEAVVTETETETEDPKIYCEPVYDFAELRGQNEDIYAWINVPGTQIDYPVLQSEDDNFYLDYNLDRTKGYPGCIYTNKCNRKDFTDKNTVLYGHNMKNGTMFGSLHKFENQEFFEQNDRIYVFTEEMRKTYQIYAAVKFSDEYIPAFYDVETEEGTEQFLAAAADCADGVQSHLREGVEAAPEDTLITLSTCVNGERHKRYIVIGKLIEEAYYDGGN